LVDGVLCVGVVLMVVDFVLFVDAVGASVLVVACVVLGVVVGANVVVSAAVVVAASVWALVVGAPVFDWPAVVPTVVVAPLSGLPLPLPAACELAAPVRASRSS